MKKFELYLISLSMLFLFVFFLTIPACLGEGCNLISFKELLNTYWFSILNLIVFIYSVFLIFKLKHKLERNNHTPFHVLEIRNDSYEHLVFLVTYIVPLVAFDFSNNRYQILFIILISVIGYMYAKTDMYFSNPSLAILGFSIFSIKAEFRGGEVKHINVLSTDKICINNEVSYIKMSKNVYIGKVL